MGVTPLLDLGMRLGEGSGRGARLVLAKTALRLHTGMATFERRASATRADAHDARPMPASE